MDSTGDTAQPSPGNFWSTRIKKIMNSPSTSIPHVDLRSWENNRAHRSREMDRQRLIVRRGQPFSISLQRSDNLHTGHHLELVLHLGEKDPVLVNVGEQHGPRNGWWFVQQEAQDEVLLTVHSPAHAAIGHYYMAVLMMSSEGRLLHKMDGISFHLLFNPWCKDDVVYLPDETLLQEYVMNENGLVYMGVWDYISSIPWNYGQFEDSVMDICFQLLDNSKEALKNPKKDVELRSDPVYVSRMVTAMVNSNGDRGVLAGRWQEPYPDGVAPIRWTGSVPILSQWSRSGLRAVRYGQCWVFAGVACTVLRCLGIPTRLITNFSSAHDVDGNLSIDFLLDENLKSFENRYKQDSSWNFHCWVESWMRRVDLPGGNDGWQVLDPTPQELSEGEFCCGPCPVRAIKEGNLGVKYDAPFVFAEVNADVVYWMVQRDGQRRKIRVDESVVGRHISTKSVYGDYREDLTVHYKYPEGSKKEREVYEKAGRQVTPPLEANRGTGQVALAVKHAQPVFGTDFDVIVEVKNEGLSEVQSHLTLLASAVTYTSVHRGECQRQRISVAVPANKVHKEVLRLRYQDYAQCVSEHRLIRVQALLESSEGDPVMAVATIPLSTPELHIQVAGKAVVREPVTTYVSFSNPLPVPLKGGVFTVEGAGLLTASQVYVEGDILPGQMVSVKFSFSPVRTGVKKLLVDFDSDRLKDVKGAATVVVRKKYRNLISALSGLNLTSV